MRSARSGSRVAMLLGLCVVSWLLPGGLILAREFTVAQNQGPETIRHGPGRQASPRGEERASARTPAPYGLSTVNLIDAARVGKPFDTRNPALNAYTNPNTSGVTFRTSWADVEPEQGRFDWSKIDTVLASAEQHGKWVRLILLPGFGTPDWALQGAQSAMFSIPYGPGGGTLRRLPLPWDGVYLNRWFAFLKQVSERYGKSPALRLIAATGPTSVSDEFTLPNSPQDLKTWQRLSYRPSKWIAAWRKVLQVYAADFPNQYVSLSFGGGLTLNDQGRMDPGERSRTRQAIIDAAEQVLGRRFALQSCNLDGVPGHGELDAFLKGYSGRIVTGFMLRTSVRGPGMGDPGDPSLALRKTIDKAMQPNPAGERINYLEIYEPDIVATDLQPVLSYGASRWARR